MLAHSTTAIVARNDVWRGEGAASEPYECGWAREAIVWVRAMAVEGELFYAMLLAPEAKEAFTAFFEKRKPDFSTFS